MPKVIDNQNEERQGSTRNLNSIKLDSSPFKIPASYNNAKIKLQMSSKAIQLNNITELALIKKPSLATFKVI